MKAVFQLVAVWDAALWADSALFSAALSAVFGNTSLSKVKNNLKELLNIFGSPDKKKPKLFFGASSAEQWTQKAKIKGLSQLASFIKDQGFDQKIILVPIGPLTNIALLFYYYPGVKKYIEELIIMGGKMNGWEFNFACDPKSVNFVLQQQIKTTICGLEVCQAQKFKDEHYITLNSELQEAIKKSDLSKGKKMAFLIKKIRGWLILNRISSFPPQKGGFFPFDPTAIAYIINPDLFKGINVPAHIPFPKKRIFSNFRFNPLLKTRINQENWGKNQDRNSWVNWLLHIKSEEFMELMLDTLAF